MSFFSNNPRISFYYLVISFYIMLRDRKLCDTTDMKRSMHPNMYWADGVDGPQEMERN